MKKPSQKNVGEGFHPSPAPEILYCGYVSLKFWTWSEKDFIGPFWRWYWNEEPGAYLSSGSDRWDLDPNHIVLVPPHTSVSSHTTREVMHLFLHFTTVIRYASERPEPIIQEITPLEIELVQRFRDVHALSSELRLIERSLICGLIIQLSLSRIPRTSWRETVADPRIARVLNRLEQPDGIHLKNENLASIAGLSTSTFSHLFTRSIGEPPHRYLLRLRLTRACRMLHITDLTLDDIAEKTGFCDRFHFSRIFRDHFKIPPAAFRKTCLPINVDRRKIST